MALSIEWLFGRTGRGNKQQKTRDLGSEEEWWSDSVGSSGSYMYWGLMDPACVSKDPAVAKQPAIPFAGLLWVRFHALCPIGNWLCQPDIYNVPLPSNA